MKETKYVVRSYFYDMRIILKILSGYDDKIAVNKYQTSRATVFESFMGALIHDTITSKCPTSVCECQIIFTTPNYQNSLASMASKYIQIMNSSNGKLFDSIPFRCCKCITHPRDCLHRRKFSMPAEFWSQKDINCDEGAWY